MKEFVLLSFLLLLSALLVIIGKERPRNEESLPNSSEELKVTIIYDNEASGNLESDWGFSALINFKNKTILFDTGRDGRILMENMKKLGIEIKNIDYVFLSHVHSDHTGGLWSLLEKNSNITIFLPSTFPNDFKDDVRDLGAKIVEISELVELFPNVYSTGVMFPIGEQSLIIRTSKGLVVITGCSHPGLVRIVEKSKKVGEKVHLLIGGFHLIGASQEEVRDIAKKLKELEVERIVPCHCSGDTAKVVFEEEFGNGYERCYAGKIISVTS